jgi:putative peptide zinc metalloprotease protein
LEVNGRYVQLTELMYRVVEKCDGEHTLDQIATELSETLPYRVNREQVAYLLETKLSPLGLLQQDEPDKSAADHTDPMSLQLRTQALSADLVTPLANALKILYKPFLLLPLLASLAGLHTWFYLNQSPSASLRTILVVPELLLVILGLSFAAALFHEIGHAAALHYGGGRARGIGFGFYLVYPAFYTDVTDGYRLDRAGRIRTDLGGIYFHLVFSAVAILSLFAISDNAVFSHALVGTIFLINLDAARQLLPFFRLDGYWVLVDAAGVHDFLSQTPAFLRGIAPWTKERLRLKPFTKAIFGGYLLLGMPLLAAVMGYFLWKLPSILASLWYAFQHHLDSMLAAAELGRWLLALTFAVSAGFVALFMTGMALMAWRLFKGSFKLLEGGFARPQTRVVTAVLAVAVPAALMMLWVPRFQDAFSSKSLPLPPGVQTFDVASNQHVEDPIAYSQSPPVGGPHHPEPLRCGFYEQPVENERVVHTMEHGAVWIAYATDLTEAELRGLRDLVESNEKLIASPYPELQNRFVLSAWSIQLEADSLRDSKVLQFIKAGRDNPRAPEAGSSC